MTELQMLAVAYVFFILLIGAEIAVSLWRRDGGYRLSEMVVNIGHGVVYQVFDHLTKGLILFPFLAISSQVTWATLPVDAWWGWLLGLLLFDLTSYWMHRHNHEIHFLWAIHGAHHAAEDYNLAAALRQPAFQNVLGWLWRLPLALVMPLEMLVGVVVFDFLYQFIQHTRYVPRLPLVGLVMNTPSHHRVHHGREEKYLDRNYGGIFIIWDRLFGTFQAEEEEPTYGITRPLGSLNVAWCNLAIFDQLRRAAATVTGRTKAAVWLRGPAALSRLAPDDPWQQPAPRPPASLPVQLYVIATAMPISPLLGWMLLTGEAWSTGVTLAVSAMLVLSVVCAGVLLERRRWAVPVEAARVLAATAGGCVVAGSAWPVAAGALMLAGLAISQRLVLDSPGAAAAK